MPADALDKMLALNLRSGYRLLRTVVPTLLAQRHGAIVNIAAVAAVQHVASAAEYVASKEAEGNAIGGLSVGEPHELMYEMTELVCGILPKEKPRYLMGVGTPANILESIALGVDMFDCVMPTRNARNGQLFTWNGVMNMRNKKWERDFSPLDPDGDSFVDSFYTKAYVRHLFASEEILAMQIGTLHNLNFYLRLVQRAREKILEGTFASWKNEMVSKLMQRL
jgi:queuine tRNA-ribosyltransferase